MKKYIPIIVPLIFALIFIVFALYFLNPPKNNLLFKYERFGGIAGLREEIEVYYNGKVVYRDLKTGKEIEINLDEKSTKLVRYLYDEIVKLSPISIKATRGADFFNHRLIIEGKNFEWVDEWAADEKEFPKEILEFNRFFSMIIMDKIMKSFTSYKIFAEGNNIRIEVELNSYYYTKNEPINIKIIVRNIGDKTISYTSPTPCHPDVLLSSDLECDIEFIKPKFSKDTICIQVIEERQIESHSFIENIAIITFKSSGIAYIKIRFPYATFEEEIATLTIPIFIYD